MTDLLTASHWSEVDAYAWRWRNFSPAEMASKGDGSLKLSRRSMDRLQRLRDRLGVPLVVLSAYRDPEHNRRVGGAKRSQHLEGRAFDISVANLDPRALIEAAREVGFTSFGTYPAQGFVHIDDRESPASWGDPFPDRASRFAPEPVARPAARAVKETAALGVGMAGASSALDPLSDALEVARGAADEAAPLLSPDLVSLIFAAIGALGVALILWRAFGRREL